MNRKKFLRKLRRELRGLPKREIEASVSFFDETIAERMECGMSETEAVAALNSPEEAALRIIKELPAEAAVMAVRKSRIRRLINIVMIVFASPIWLSLLIAIMALVISLAAVYASVVLMLFAAAAGLAVGAVGCIAYILMLDSVSVLLGGGAGFICAGTAILLFVCGSGILRATVTVCKMCRKRRKVAVA